MKGGGELSAKYELQYNASSPIGLESLKKLPIF
jgi:hypothetical protein